jgi:hypothetical protein
MPEPTEEPTPALGTQRLVEVEDLLGRSEGPFGEGEGFGHGSRPAPGPLEGFRGSFPHGPGWGTSRRQQSLFEGSRSGGSVAVLTVGELTEAIRHTLVAHGKVPADRAEAVATQVLNYFGAEEMVLDNVLSAEDRDTFYQLEEEGLLTSEEEDAMVARGKTWRIHYWLLRKASIGAAARPPEAPAKEDPGAVYQDMPMETWSSHGSKSNGKPLAP